MKRHLILLLILIITTITSCNNKREKEIKYGDTVIVTEKCIVAIDKDSYKEMTKLCNRKDERGLEIMHSNGLIFILDKGSTGVVTEFGFGMTKIRLLDDTEIWCNSNFLK